MARIRKRVGVLMNVDETVEQANLILERLDTTLDQFDGTLREFNATLERFTIALEQFGPVVTKVDQVGDDLDVAVGRVDHLASSLAGITNPALGLPDQIRRIAGRATGKAEDEPEKPQDEPKG